MTFFQNEMGGLLNDLIEPLTIASGSAQILALKSVVVLWATVMIMYIGFNALLGKTQDPMREVVGRMIAYSVIAAFAFGFDGWLNSVSSIMKELEVWANGGTTVLGQLDGLGNLFNRIAQSFDATGGVVEGPVAKILTWVAFGLMALPAAIVYITNKFAITLLIVVAPFAITALFFGWIKQTFAKWLSLFLSALFVLILIGIVFRAIISSVGRIALKLDEAASTGQVDVIASVMLFLLLGVMMTYIVKIVVSIGINLGGSGVDDIGMSATGSIQNSLMNYGGSAAKGAGRGARKSGSALLNKARGK